MKTGLFDNHPTFEHSKLGHVQLSNPFCFHITQTIGIQIMDKEKSVIPMGNNQMPGIQIPNVMIVVSTILY